MRAMCSQKFVDRKMTKEQMNMQGFKERQWLFRCRRQFALGIYFAAMYRAIYTGREFTGWRIET